MRRAIVGLALFALVLPIGSAPVEAQAGKALNAIESFVAAGLPVAEVFAYTEETGTLLGRPGQFIEKVVWHDTRLERHTSLDGIIDLDSGGTIERFRNRSELLSRLRYIETFDGTILSTNDYRWEMGLMLLRVTFILTPSQAEQYRAAMAGEAGSTRPRDLDPVAG